MGGKKRLNLSYIILIFWLFLLACNFEPLKSINERYSAPWYLLLLGFFISGAIGFAVAYLKGKDVGVKA